MTTPEPPGRLPLHRRMHRFWLRHRTLFWILHSVWALGTGVVVIFLAHERYGFLPWLMGFMLLTWASTLFFGRRSAVEVQKEAAAHAENEANAPGVLEEITSYLTRIMYQETLFFLLPFYAYSTVWGSPNVLFLAVLGSLAFISCLDLIFDRWLRASPVFGLLFFASVAFAALNLVIPMLAHLAPRLSTPVAAGAAVLAAAPLGWRATRGHLAGRLRLGLAGALFLGLVASIPALVPPVPIRLQSTVFSTSIDRETLTPADTLGARAAAGALPDGLVVLARVFAPSALPASVSVEWKRDDSEVRTTRSIEVLAHADGFRIWDALRPDGARLPPGRYKVVLRTAGHRVFGVSRIELEAGGGAPAAPEPSAGDTPDSSTGRGGGSPRDTVPVAVPDSGPPPPAASRSPGGP